jgi:hypothetical protein
MTGALVKWQHPQTGEQFTFQDCRPGAKAASQAAEPAESFTFPVTMQQVAGHEGRHLACGSLFDFKMSEARADIPDESCYGRVIFDHAGEQWDRLRCAEMAVTLLVGGIGEKDLKWPPTWPLNPNSTISDERNLAVVVERMRINEKTWNGLVDIAHWLIKQPTFKRIENRYGALLGCGLTLNRNMITDIYKSIERETAEEAEAEAERNRPRTQHEIDAAEMRAQHRQWMTGVLEAGVAYAEEQAEEKAARDLRRRCDQTTSRLERELGSAAHY